MKAKVAKFVVIIYQIISIVKSEIFTSTEILKDIFIFEKIFADFLSSAIPTTKPQELQIENYLNNYKSAKLETDAINDHQEGENKVPGVEVLAENPIHVFQLCKRLTTHRTLIKTYRSNDVWRGLNKTNFRSKINLPNDEDVEGAAVALIRLQSVYKLNVTNLAKGNILGVQSSAVLSAVDCYDLGKRAFVMGLHFNAVEWLKESYGRAGAEVNSTISQSQVLKILKKATSFYNEENPNAASGSKFEGGIPVPEGELRSKIKSRNIGSKASMDDLFENYEALCRGESLISEEITAKLKCFYDRRDSSYLILMPTKVEVRHLEPEILVFHDVLSADEILRLKLLAIPKLSRGITQGMPNEESSTSVSRTSQVAWMDAYENPLLTSIEKRIEILTGLKTDLQTGSSELLQVANYGTGGHYILHYDYLFAEDSLFQTKLHPRELELGDRVATFMFYASTVQRGGATVFPYLGASIWPSKGSAAFWYNLKDFSKGDERTLHGACPVLYGSKWVVNKWIRAKGQSRKMECNLPPVT